MFILGCICVALTQISYNSRTSAREFLHCYLAFTSCTVFACTSGEGLVSSLRQMSFSFYACHLLLQESWVAFRQLLLSSCTDLMKLSHCHIAPAQFQCGSCAGTVLLLHRSLVALAEVLVENVCNYCTDLVASIAVTQITRSSHTDLM